MRRKDKEIKDKAEIESIIKRATVCRIGLSENNVAYIVPMNFGYKDNSLYFHSAPMGKKIEIIKGFDNTLWLIDFDFAGYGFWAYDIASFLTCSDFFKSIGYETWKIEHINEQEFFKGYESLIQLNSEERKLISTLMAAHWIQIAGEMAGTHLRGTKMQKKGAKKFASKIVTYLPSIKL